MIRQATINGKELLFVEVPDKFSSTSIYIDNHSGLLLGHADSSPRNDYVLHGNIFGWKFLFTTNDVTEDQAAGVVEMVDYDVPPGPSNDFGGDWRTGYRDYYSTEETGYSEYPFTRTAIESLHSLMFFMEISTHKKYAVLQK